MKLDGFDTAKIEAKSFSLTTYLAGFVFSLEPEVLDVFVLWISLLSYAFCYDSLLTLMI